MSTPNAVVVAMHVSLSGRNAPLQVVARHIDLTEGGSVAVYELAVIVQGGPRGLLWRAHLRCLCIPTCSMPIHASGYSWRHLSHAGRVAVFMSGVRNKIIVGRSNPATMVSSPLQCQAHDNCSACMVDLVSSALCCTVLLA